MIEHPARSRKRFTPRGATRQSVDFAHRGGSDVREPKPNVAKEGSWSSRCDSRPLCRLGGTVGCEPCSNPARSTLARPSLLRCLSVNGLLAPRPSSHATSLELAPLASESGHRPLARHRCRAAHRAALAHRFRPSVFRPAHGPRALAFGPAPDRHLGNRLRSSGLPVAESPTRPSRRLARLCRHPAWLACGRGDLSHLTGQPSWQRLPFQRARAWHGGWPSLQGAGATNVTLRITPRCSGQHPGVRPGAAAELRRRWATVQRNSAPGEGVFQGMSADSSHRCPREGSCLVPRDLDGVVLWSCETCQGLLLQPPALEQLKTRALAGHAPPRSAAQANIVHEGTARCICTRGPVMTNVTGGAVVFDLCPRCGSVWLDGGEVADFLRPYGPARTSTQLLGGLLDLLPILVLLG